LKLLADQFLKNIAPEKSLAPEAWTVMNAHAWPGNVRELEHVLTRAALLSDGATIRAEDLQLEATPMPNDLRPDFFWDEAEDLSIAQERFTQKLVQSALTKFNGSRPMTAKKLGISERTLYRILSESANSGGPS
jgi:two-component system NtrC family response regulator